MSSNQNNTTSYDFQIILHKVKYVSKVEQSIKYSLYIQYENEEVEIDKISDKEKDLQSKSYTFQINNISQPFPSIVITAYTTSWFMLSEKIASITIPLSLSKLNAQRQWYYMRNTDDENVISILISFSSHSIPLPNKQEQSMSEMIHTHLLSSLLSRTSITPNVNKHISYDSGLLLRQKTTNSASLDNKIEKKFQSKEDKDNIEKEIKEKSKILNKVDEHVRIQNLQCSLALEKLKERESIIKKEKIRLNENIDNNNNLQLEYENKSIYYSQNRMNFGCEYNKYLIEQEINDFDKELYFNMNSLYLVNNNIDENKELKSRVPDNMIDIHKTPKPSSTKIPETISFHKTMKSNYQNPSNKKSNSTNMTSTNSSEISLNDYNMLKTPQITQIFLNTQNNCTSKFIEILDTDTYTKRGSLTNHSYYNNTNTNIQSNSIRKNMIATNKKTHIKKGAYSNLCLGSANIKKKQKKQTIGLASHKPINTVYNSNIKLYSSYFQNSSNNSHQNVNLLSSSHFSTRSYFKVKRNKKL